VLPGTPPEVSFTFTPTPVTVDQDVFFSAEASTAVLPRRIVRFEWDFGDGTTAVGVTVTHRFKTVGTYTVVLTATDDAGTIGRPETPTTIAVTVGCDRPQVRRDHAARHHGDPSHWSDHQGIQHQLG
jgi:PKD repeat protein